MSQSKVFKSRMNLGSPVASIEGCRILLQSGRRLTDLSGVGHVLVLGSNRQGLENDLSASFNRSLIPGSGRLVEFDSASDLASNVLDQWGDPNGRAYFAPSGTDAIELAMQVALFVQDSRSKSRGNARKTGILGSRDSYHGMSIAATSVGGHADHRARLQGVLQPWPKLPSLSEPLDVWASPEVLSLLDDAAAIVIEPIGGTTSGAVVPDEGVLEFVVGQAHERGCIVIADEVVTGFGRTGTPFVLAAGLPDITVSGKWLAGGYVAIAALLFSSRLVREMDRFVGEPPLRFTFANSALACSIALTLQAHVEADGLVDQVSNRGTLLRESLASKLETAGVSADVRGAGLLAAVEIRTDDVPGELKRLKRSADQGDVLAMFGSRRSARGGRVHVMCTPPMDVSDEDIEIVALKLTEVVSR